MKGLVLSIQNFFHFPKPAILSYPNLSSCVLGEAGVRRVGLCYQGNGQVK